MTTRRALLITAFALLLAPALYWGGAVKFYDNSAQPNPQRAMVALFPFVLSASGTVINWFEQRAHQRSQQRSTADDLGRSAQRPPGRMGGAP